MFTVSRFSFGFAGTAVITAFMPGGGHVSLTCVVLSAGLFLAADYRRTL